MNYKEIIESLTFTEENKKLQTFALCGYLHSYKPNKAFKIKIDTGQKTATQLKAFYSALEQLLPQYNKDQEFKGEMIFHKDEFKFILKYVGGWYKEIKNKKGDMMPIEKSFTKITKEDMMIVLKKINIWAMNKNFSLSIDRELMDLVK